MHICISLSLYIYIYSFIYLSIYLSISHMCIYIYICIHAHTLGSAEVPRREFGPDKTRAQFNSTGQDVLLFGRPILYTTTTQRGWCIEAFVSILAQLQSQNSL